MWADERVVNVFGLARRRKTTMASARSLTTDRIWRVLEKTAFAVISFVTPEGEPRSSRVVCAAARRHLYVVTAWAAGRRARSPMATRSPSQFRSAAVACSR
jgi:hypothetical protein